MYGLSIKRMIHLITHTCISIFHVNQYHNETRTHELMKWLPMSKKTWNVVIFLLHLAHT